MNKLDQSTAPTKRDWNYADLDGHLLQLLVAVVEEGTITGAAQRLGVTQSAVSHVLDKLRVITGNPLFVKSGRGIVATAHAEQLVHKARELLTALEGFATCGEFDPARWRCTFTIAANDFQREVLLPPLMAWLRRQAPGVVLRVIASNIPSLDMLRQEHCQLVISPRPPDGGDVMQKRLFEDDYCVYFDASQRDAPRSLAEYLAAQHITVLYEPRRPLDLDQWLSSQGIARNFQVLVPGLAALPAFVRGTQLLATAPSLLHQHLFKDLSQANTPMPCPKMPMYMVWHKRYQDDPSHRWLRSGLGQISLQVMGDTAPVVAGLPCDLS